MILWRSHSKARRWRAMFTTFASRVLLAFSESEGPISCPMPASVHDARQAGTLHGGGLRGGKQVSTKAALRSSFQGRGIEITSSVALSLRSGPRPLFDTRSRGHQARGTGYRKQGCASELILSEGQLSESVASSPDSRHSPSGRRVRLLPLRRKTTATMKKLPL
jgi:hypothetical protein